MAAAARRLQLAEYPLQQLALEQPIGLWCQVVPIALPLQALLLGQVAQVIVDCPLQAAQRVQVGRLGELGQRVHVDQGDLSRLAGLHELLEQFIDLLQLLLDLQGLGDRHGGAPDERIFGRQFVDFVLLSQPLDQLHQLAGE